MDKSIEELERKRVRFLNGDCLEELDKIEENSVESIVTDPPYGLTSIVKRFGKENSAPAQYGKDGSFSRLSKGFMGKEWDGSGIEYNVEMWQKCLRVLKPGGYLLAFGGSRTFHRIAVAIEDAGFEIRDTIMWLYGSGFPKSQNISKMLDKKFGEERPIIGYTTNAGIAKNAKPDSSGSHIWSGNIRSDEPITNLAKQWQSWGTALKPSFEPIIVARKPFKGSLVDNVIEYGVGGINIDECRVETNGELIDNHKTAGIPFMRDAENYRQLDRTKSTEGRFPANTILTYDDTNFEEVCGGFPNTKTGIVKVGNTNSQGLFGSGKAFIPNKVNGGDSGSASRYFYCAKASKKDRDEGLEKFKEKNTHPTVKPTSLMQYLIRLVTPKGGVILDPFMGSGSTGKAAMFENKERNADYKFIGIEKEKEYIDIAKARIDFAIKLANEEKQEEAEQITFFE